MKIKIFFTAKTRAIRPRWLLEELNVAYELKHIDLFAGEGQTEEYKLTHPLGQVPAIEVDGEIQIESGAMCHRLADLYPEGGLAPAMDSTERSRYEQWMFFAPGTLEPPAWLVLLHSMILPEEMRCTSIVPWALERHANTLSMLNSELKGRSYLMDEQFTAADIMVGTALMWLPDLLSGYPALQEYVDRLRERPAYQRATAE